MLKEKILELKEKGFTQTQISKTLGISSSTVCYHLNPNILKNILKRRKDRDKLPITSVFKDKEIEVPTQIVCWKVAEAKALTRLIELGYEVFTPFITGGEIDLIAYKDDKSYRIQIKSISPKKNSISVCTMRTNTNYKKFKRVSYTNIDFFLIYDGANIYKIDNDTNIQSITLSYKIPKNNQVRKIRMAKDYIF